ncbi:hypothetical protein [Isoptericola sp. NPDC055881]
MKIVGLDLSLTSTGIASVVPDAVQPALGDRFRTKPAGDDLRARARRLHEIRDAVRDWTRTRTDLAVVEGLAFSSRSGQATERAGLWWLVVHDLLVRDIPVAVVTPTARAKYATGKGNAGKDEVLAAVVRRYPDVETRGNDEADALVLAAMGARALGHPIDDLPKTHTDAMAKVAWPELEETR